MNALTLVSTVMSYSATATTELENAELTLLELERMYSDKNAPKRMIRRAIKMQKNIIKGLK